MVRGQTNWKGHSRVRFSDCKGCYHCTSDRCPFKTQYGVTNTTQFETKRDKRLHTKDVVQKGNLFHAEPGDT